MGALAFLDCDFEQMLGKASTLAFGAAILTFTSTIIAMADDNRWPRRFGTVSQHSVAFYAGPDSVLL